MNITTHFTSPCRSKSNGLIKRQVGKVRSALEMIGKLTKIILSKVVFDLNSMHNRMVQTHHLQNIMEGGMFLPP